MFSTKPYMKHVIIANLVAAIVSFFLVGLVVYSWIDDVVPQGWATLLSYTAMSASWIFLFAKVHRAIDINARQISFSQHTSNAALTSLSATIVLLITWASASFFTVFTTSIILVAGLLMTGSLQISLYARSLHASVDTSKVKIK